MSKTEWHDRLQNKGGPPELADLLDQGTPEPASSAKLEAIPTRLYHGTAGRWLDTILQQGLLPRVKLEQSNGRNSEGNWEHSVPSHPELVYLTNAYPLHFTGASLLEDETNGLIVEIDTTKLDPDRFRPDEDFLEQATRGHDDLDPNMPLAVRNRHYRDRIADYEALPSLQHLGTVGYAGSIPFAAIARIMVVETSAIGRLIMLGFDPVISLANYRHAGSFYRSGTRWMFGDTDLIYDLPARLKPALSREGITTYVRDELLKFRAAAKTTRQR